MFPSQSTPICAAEECTELEQLHATHRKKKKEKRKKERKVLNKSQGSYILCLANRSELHSQESLLPDLALYELKGFLHKFS